MRVAEPIGRITRSMQRLDQGGPQARNRRRPLSLASAKGRKRRPFSLGGSSRGPVAKSEGKSAPAPGEGGSA